MKNQSMVISLIALLILLTGCAQPRQPPTGKTAIVQFRRDALGSASNIPVSPATGSINGAKVCLTGKLLTVNEEWIVLEYEKQKHWIPRDVVLLIKVIK